MCATILPFLHTVQTNGMTYADLCTKQSDGITCAYIDGAVTRFWGDNFEAYEVCFVLLGNECIILCMVGVSLWYG